MNTGAIVVWLVLMSSSFLHGAADAKLKQLVKETAQKACDALVKEDYAKLVDLTHSKVVEMLGGREKMVALLESVMQEMKSMGVTFESATADAPEKIVSSKSHLIAIVPETIRMKVKGGKITQRSFLIGVSSDKGKTWTFIDGVKLDNESIKKVLPDFPSSIKLPQKQEPIFEKD